MRRRRAAWGSHQSPQYGHQPQLRRSPVSQSHYAHLAIEDVKLGLFDDSLCDRPEGRLAQGAVVAAAADDTTPILAVNATANGVSSDSDGPLAKGGVDMVCTSTEWSSHTPR